MRVPLEGDEVDDVKDENREKEWDRQADIVLLIGVLQEQLLVLHLSSCLFQSCVCVIENGGVILTRVELMVSQAPC